MKNSMQIFFLMRIFLIVLIVSSFTTVHAQSLSRDEKDIKLILSNTKLSDDQDRQVYDVLDRIIDNKVSISTKDLLEMCYAYSKLNNSDAPYDLIYKLKKGNPVEFEKALNQLSSEKRVRIKEIVEMSEAEEAYGNG